MQIKGIHTLDNQDFIDQSTALIADVISSSIKKRGECIIGLSGGSTPKPIYEALGKMELPWDKVKIFLVDERYISADDTESNQRLLKDTLLSSAAIPKEHIYFPNTALPLSQCIEEYARNLQVIITDHLPDLVILGMGEDGHIASLFPPVSELALGDQALIIHTTTDAFAIHDRISVSLNLLGASDQQLFLLRGEKKKKVWESMLKSKEGDSRWPAKRIIEGERVTVVWG